MQIATMYIEQIEIICDAKKPGTDDDDAVLAAIKFCTDGGYVINDMKFINGISQVRIVAIRPIE